MVNKKVVIIITILAIIVVALIVWYGVTLLQNTDYTFEQVSATSEVDENLTNNNTIDDNSIDENTVNNNNNVTENTSSQQNTTETNSSTSESDPEDIAIILAQETWEETEQNQDVYYYVEGELSENVYMVSIRSKETTEALIYYEVNVDTSEVSEY